MKKLVTEKVKYVISADWGLVSQTKYLNSVGSWEFLVSAVKLPPLLMGKSI